MGAYSYQKRTGPTYPLRGAVTIDGTDHKYRLIRSEETIRDADVVLPEMPEQVTAELFWKRFNTEDEFTSVPLERNTESGDLVAPLPAQPAAGKLEYYLIVHHGDAETRVPAESDDNIIIRFKDPVPDTILWPHIIMMFFSILFGMRAGLSALFAPSTMRYWSWTTLFGLTLGGMVLGPIVQKYAFGHYWTGWPNGYDLTDNKLLILWLSWLFACTTIGFSRRKFEGIGRAVVATAAVAMMVVYLIPHSMRGSELDYSKVDQGVDPAKAIGTSEE